MEIKYDRFQPCEHKGCLNHISHPCEGCGRIGGDGVIYKNEEGDILEKLRESGKKLKELLNITEEDVNTSLREIRKEWK